MTEKEVILTYEGLQRLEEEFDYLKGSKRMEVAERIKQALSFGDISENSEYDDAKNDQAQMEIRIINLENMLKNAKVIDEDELSTETVALGTKVKLFDMDENVEITYMIVGSTETNPIKQKISNESPVGAALIGKRKDDIVKITVPRGFANYKIVDILK